ncbi:hypothetical protein B0A48_08700 [Cryoendolithus antarcticus]|uniref:Oxidoreductase n=1 Tax=Cryoendolithus antarcticus TaxID=1507870 RepID=A0A1V8T4L4_9PEZI|nr:hypothetical protein B0A48_08700 [Cryoendolithus antarcticus]
MTKGLAFHFDPATEIPSQKGKILFVTVYFLKMDLASFESVKAAAADFFRREARLDLLMANAGVMAVPPGLTKDGYEVQFGTNHLGHATLINLLLPTLALTAEQGHDIRIVILSSDLFKFMSSTISLSKMHTTQSAHGPLAPQRRYGESKLANQLYARELARRYPTITTVAIHPGVSNTGLQDNFTGPTKMMVRAAAMVMPMMTAEQTAWNQTWAATAPLGSGEKMVRSGVYYEPVGVEAKLPKHGKDDVLAGRLWEWTATELRKFGIK